MTYTLITANRNYSSWSLRPWVLMKALNLPFEDRIEPFAAASNYAAFRSFSPTGQVPALIDGDRTVWDSLGITLYLADRHAGVWPADEAARAFAQCAVAEMHSGFATLRSDCTMNVGVRVEPNIHSPALGRDIARKLVTVRMSASLVPTSASATEPSIKASGFSGVTSGRPPA